MFKKKKSRFPVRLKQTLDKETRMWHIWFKATDYSGKTSAIRSQVYDSKQSLEVGPGNMKQTRLDVCSDWLSLYVEVINKWIKTRLFLLHYLSSHTFL